MKLNSHNEWDRLKEIVVGNAETKACLPYSSTKEVSEEKRRRIEELAGEVYPKWLIDEVNEDLQGLCDTLSKFDVKVLRPSSSNVGMAYATPDWFASGDRQYNMRDLHLVVGNTVIESPSQERHRLFEATGLYQVWYDYFTEGFRWIAAPKPRLAGEYFVTYHEDGHTHQKLSENEILFEAANTVRMGKDLLYLISRSGNRLGAQWLQSVLGEEYRIHTTEKIYRSSHIDSTIMCLRPGLVLLNGSRVKPETCPKIFAKWDKIYFHDIVPTPVETKNFHETVIQKVCAQLKMLDIQTDIAHLASDWIGMNFLSVDPGTVIVDKRQTSLIKVLESHKVNTIPISFRHSHLLKGGIHCSTLDTVRESKLESYFD